MLTLLQTVGLVTGLAGQWLVAKRKRSAFVVWGVSNIAIIWVQVATETYLLALMFSAYLVLCVYAFFQWGAHQDARRS